MMSTYLDDLIAGLNNELHEEKARLESNVYGTKKTEELHASNFRRLQQRLEVLQQLREKDSS